MSIGGFFTAVTYVLFFCVWLPYQHVKYRKRRRVGLVLMRSRTFLAKYRALKELNGWKNES